MARRSAASRSTPKAEQAQSNTVLIVFVVISMLANVGLGIMWYLSQDEIVNAKKQASDERAKAGNAEAKKKEFEHFYLVRLRQMLDGSTTDSDLADMRAESGKASQAPLDWWPALSRKIEGDPNAQDANLKNGVVGPFDPTTGKLANNFAGRLKVLDDQVTQLRKQLKSRDDDLARVTSEYNEYKKNFNEALLAQKLNDAGKRSDADTKEKLNQKEIVIKDLTSKISGLEKQVAAMLEEQKSAALAKEKQLSDRFEAALASKEKELQETRQLLDSRKQVQLDKPRGQIVKADPNGETVYINLGSDQRLTPGTTFSVHGRGPGGVALPDPKARIEVISVLGPKVALARVKQMARPEGSRPGLTSSDAGFWVNDPKDFWRIHNPLLPGELLYNPAWEPNREVHVALAGYFDIDGDGQDDLQAFIRLLRNHGVEVDAYLDPAEGFKQRGRLTNQTEFLIKGGVTAGKAEAINNIEAEAAKKGIETVSLNRFLDRMGLSPERMPISKNGKMADPGAAGGGDKPAGDKPAGDKPAGEGKEGDKANGAS